MCRDSVRFRLLIDRLGDKSQGSVEQVVNLLMTVSVYRIEIVENLRYASASNACLIDFD